MKIELEIHVHIHFDDAVDLQAAIDKVTALTKGMAAEDTKVKNAIKGE